MIQPSEHPPVPTTCQSTAKILSRDRGKSFFAFCSRGRIPSPVSFCHFFHLPRTEETNPGISSIFTYCPCPHCLSSCCLMFRTVVASCSLLPACIPISQAPVPPQKELSSTHNNNNHNNNRITTTITLSTFAFVYSTRTIDGTNKHYKNEGGQEVLTFLLLTAFRGKKK